MPTEGRPRVAWWSPLPPQQTGIADYSFELLAELASELSIVAVVRDDAARHVQAPEGVPVIGASAYLSGATGGVALDVYQMGNHPWFHGYMHAAALSRPGLLVLHDPSLLDFYGVACGGMESPVLLEEARIDEPSLVAMPMVDIDGREEPDRLRVLLSRRLVEASLMTVVHSPWARDELARRSPEAVVRHIYQPARIVRAQPHPPSPIVFGVFGNIERAKRTPAVVESFARVHRAAPGRARLVIAGRASNPREEEAVREAIRASGSSEAIELLTDLPFERFEAEISATDVVISLRWPTNGEVSAAVLRAMGSGKPVVVSDLPQYRELDPTFCWRVPVGAHEGAALEGIMRRAIDDSCDLAGAGAAATRFVETEAALPIAARRYVEAVDRCLGLRTERQCSSRYARPGRDPLPGVNVIADWQVTTGLAESARRSVTALVAGGVPVSVHEQLIPGHPREGQLIPAWMNGLPRGRPHDIEICYLNVNELSVMSDAELHPPGRRNYVIGFWFWELPSVAPSYAQQIDRIDEIWVGSRFTRDALLGHTSKPVHVMPCVVDLPLTTSVTRHELGLPEDACIFFFHFDSSSTFARKNPWGVIRAFRKAFTPEERSGRVLLAMKTRNLARIPAAGAERLARELHEVGGMFIDLELSPEGMASLIACTDVYVSLHRSEGFGLGIAEAMLLGKPAIATAYSGNLDFMSNYNSCLVGYGLRSVDNAEVAYNPGMEFVYERTQLWAEPNVDHASRWMRWLYDNPQQRAKIGAAGAATIREKYSPAAAGAAAGARLASLARARRSDGDSSLATVSSN